MLVKRIIPCLDVKDGRVVKGVNFLDLKDAGDPVENAKFYQKEGADELIFLDITASSQKRKAVTGVIEKVSRVISMPFTVGGGIKNNQDIREILLAGADKVSINTAAVKKPDLIAKAVNAFGSQCIVVAIDAKNDPSLVSSGWQVYINGGREPAGLDVVDWAKKVEMLGAGEILLTSMDCDGRKNGFDLSLVKAVSEAVNIPVIASGGAGTIEHFCQVFKKTRASAALAASIFHYRQVSIKKLKKTMVEKAIEVRI